MSEKHSVEKNWEIRNNFIKCGLTGWCLEILWTGLHAPLKRDRKLMGSTSLLMFPIYGMAGLISPIKKKLCRHNFFTRGLVYTGMIFSTEYLTGSLLKKHQMCPWDYSDCKHNYKGVIRIDYAPVWFIVGLIFEKIT